MLTVQLLGVTSYFSPLFICADIVYVYFMSVIKMNNNLLSKKRYNIKSVVLTKFVNRREKERFFHYLCSRIIAVH